MFWVFVRIGLFTIGGGYAMLPLIEREVLGRGWVSREEFGDVLAVAQSLPGVLAVNVALMLGYRRRGVWGGVVCALGAVLPSFVIVLLLAMFFSRVGEVAWVGRVFRGLRPAAVGLIAASCLSAGRTAGRGWARGLMVLSSAMLIWRAGVSPVYVLLLAAAGGVLYGICHKKGGR